MNKPDAPETKLPDAETLKAILASLRLWLLDVFAALLDVFGKRSPIARDIAAVLRANLRAAEYDAKRAFLGLAILRMDMPSAGALRRPGGFACRRWRTSHIRFLTHGVFNARPLALRARIARLRDILENAEAWTARLLKRLKRGFNGDHLILAAPPVARAFSAPVFARAAADSS